MSARFKVAIAGAGYFSQFHAEAWSRLPSVTVVACADRSLDKARAKAAQHGIPAVYDDVACMLDSERPDLLDIVTPPDTHFDLIRLAAVRGVHVICQKAFCRSLAEATTAVEVAERAGIVAIVHENFRFQPWHREAKRLLTVGDLGTPYQITFRLRPGDGQGPRAYLDRQPYFQQMPRFLVHETAIHFIDTFRFLLGEVVSVYADLRRLNPAIAGEDAGVILFTFASGVRAIFDGNRLADHPARNRRLTMGEMLLEGSAATLRLDGDGALHRRAYGANDETILPYPWQDVWFGGDCVHALQRSAVEAIVGRRSPENAARDYLANLRVEEAIYRSAEEGRRVDVRAGD